MQATDETPIRPVAVRQARRRERVFDFGATALQRKFPAFLEALYACPLCLGLWARESATTGDLKLEDVPPKWIGGRPVALTCFNCNNTAGQRLEPEMQRFEVPFDFGSGTMEEPMPASFCGPAGRVNISVLSHDGNILVFGKPRNNHPDAQRAFESSLGDLVAQPGACFEIEPGVGFRFNVAKVGWLKSAYMVAFAAFGYRYVIHSRFDPIRKQIAAPEQELLTGFWAGQPIAGRSARQLGLVRFAEGVSSVAVQMGRHIVFLPNEGDVYVHLADTLAKGEHFKFDAEVLEWPSTLVMALDQAR